jgi:cyclase
VISDVARVFGNQAAVVSIEARKIGYKSWEAFTEAGREPTGKGVINWAKQAESLGAGEISVTSVDKDGTLKGPDFELIQELRPQISIPLVVGGGVSSQDHIVKLAESDVDGIMVGMAFHRKVLTIEQCKNALINSGFETR